MRALDEIEERVERELVDSWSQLARDNYIDFYEFMNRDDSYEATGHQRLIGELLIHPGEALWSELFDLSYLLKLKGTMESGSWNSLYQGTPMDVEGGTISAAWFMRYDRLPDRKNVRKVVLSVDAANTVKERSDFSVILVWFQDENRNHYLADVVRKKVELTALKTLIQNTARQWDADAILVEAKGNGLAYIQLFKDPSEKAPAPIIPIDVNNQTKEFRFDKVSPVIQAGHVFLPTRAIWLPDYEKELVAFPHGKHDDQVDATSQYLDWAKVRGARGTKKLGGMSHTR
jgi:predicted phage terminase large subunit-like protein